MARSKIKTAKTSQNQSPEKLQSITFSQDQKTRDQMTEIVADQEKGKFREMGLKLERGSVGFERNRWMRKGSVNAQWEWKRP